MNFTREFNDFMGSASGVPDSLRNQVRESVLRRLNPSPFHVFYKAGLIQVVVGLVTLAFCPQFGFSLSGSHGLMHYLMRFGVEVCMVGCGALFAGTSLLASSWLLSRDEVRVFREHRVLQSGVLSLAAVGVFLCLGAEVLEVLTVFWLIGSVIGGIASLEIGWAFRHRVWQRWIYA